MTDLNVQEIKLSERQAECLRFIEQEYMLHGTIPSVDRIREVLDVPLATVKKWLSSDTFDALLRGQGIETKPTKGILSGPQLMLANMLLNLGDRRSEREKCEAANVTPQRLAVWRKDPAFLEYMHKRAEDAFHNSSDVAYMSVLKNVKAGDMNATKLYLEMTGKYQPSMRHEVNMDSFAQGIVEILSRRIPDRQLLEVIAGDIENLLAGKPIEFDTPARASIPAASVEVSGGVVGGQSERQVAPALLAGEERPAPPTPAGSFNINPNPGG